MGHARALLPLLPEQQYEAAQIIVKRGLSVRESEALSRSFQSGKSSKPAKTKKIDPDVQRLQNELAEKLAARVQIQYGNTGKGKLQIAFNSLDELEGILAHIS